MKAFDNIHYLNKKIRYNSYKQSSAANLLLQQQKYFLDEKNLGSFYI